MPLRRFVSHRLFLWLLAGGAGVALLGWGGGLWAAQRARSTLSERLAKRGLELTCDTETWSPWGGVNLQGAKLRRMTGDKAPVAALSNLHVDVDWDSSLKARTAVTRWHVQDATLTVHDAEGAVTLEQVGTDFVAQNDELAMERLTVRDGPVTYDVKGLITLGPKQETTPQGDFQLRLRALRATLNTLRFTGEGAYKVTGEFALDVRERPWKWTATLKGEGQNVVWRNVPLREAVSEGHLSDAGMKISNRVAFTQGAAQVEITREGWKQSPLNLQGTLTDSEGRRDEFHGVYQTGERTLKIAELNGKADLLDLLSNIPALAEKMPRTVKVKTFPEIAMRDFLCQWRQRGEPPAWSVDSLQLRSPADVVVTVRKSTLNIEDITGSLAYADRSWTFREMKGKLLGGSFSLAGRYDGRALREAEIGVRSLNLSRLSPWVGKVNGKLDKSEMTMSYRGSICGREPELSTGSGTVVLTNAPVVHIPVLDQAYSLFPKLLPKSKTGAGECQVSFVMTKGVAAIDPFKARSESVTVTAKGTVDLVRKRVSGHARANLRGVVGVVTSPLSHVLTDMEISGPLNDIRIAPQGPAGAAKKAVKVATGGAKFSSKVVGTGLTLPFRALGMLDD